MGDENRPKIHNLIREGGEGNFCFRDKEGRRVNVELVETRTYRRDKANTSWGDIGEVIPEGCDASYTRFVEQAIGSGAFYYTIDYYKILGFVD